MTMPGFTAENSLYDRSSRYAQSGGSRNAKTNAVIPAIPSCANCDWILDNCEANGFRPYALCSACATGNCYEPRPISTYG